MLCDKILSIMQQEQQYANWHKRQRSETGSKKKSKIPLEGREKRALVLLEAKWFVKEWEPEGKAGQLVLMHTVKGTLAGNGNYEVLFPLGGAAFIYWNIPLQWAVQQMKTKVRGVQMWTNMWLYIVHVCVHFVLSSIIKRRC